MRDVLERIWDETFGTRHADPDGHLIVVDRSG